MKSRNLLTACMLVCGAASPALAQQAGGLARQAVEVLFQNALSAPTKKDSRLQRYFRDVAMYNSHVSALQSNQATFVARAHFGRPTGFRGLQP